jgi:hypothetical protein
MAYTTIDKPDDYFNTVLYTGTGSSRNQTGVGFDPDWVWIKSRSNAYNNNVWDRVRGAGERLITNATDAEETQTGDMSAFVTDGVTLGGGNITNASGATYAMWNWLAGGTGVSNTQGSITSTVSANTTSGFSVVTFTSTGSTSTVGHGLGSAPAMIIGKRRDSTSTWTVGHQSLGWTKFLRLEDTTAVGTETGWWNNTNPTSIVFTHGTNWNAGTWVAYCFAEVKGYSKFGSYAGNNNADGTFVYTGFSPSFLLVKRYGGGTQNWVIYDNKRNTYNLTNSTLRPNLSDAEATNNGVDLLSNGFKFRSSDGDSNGYSDGYIYMAFAENPFVTSTSIPTTAR